MKTENDFFDAAWDGSSLAKKRVSFLKIEPKVSNFYLKQSTKKRQKDTTYAII